MFDDFQDMDEEQEGSFGSYTPEEPEGLKNPRESNLCLGHAQTEQTLLDLINSGNIPHAMIFAGPVGIGKSTMAFRLARYLLKNGTDNHTQDSLFGDAPAEATTLDIPSDDPVFAKVTSGGHPDLLTIERQIDTKKGTKKNNLDVETARKVAPFLRMTSASNGWRVVIVDDADSMNRNAQNALLKILEEPPSNALLILITHRLGAIIPTIRSRCRTLSFDPLSEDILAQLMTREVGGTLSDQDNKLLASLAAGSIGAAQKIIETKGLETAQNVLTIFERWPNFNWVDIHHLADSAGRANQIDSFRNIEETFLWMIEQIIFAKAKNQNELSAPLNTALFTKICADYPLETWLKIFETLKDHFAQAHFANLDKKQAVLGAFNLITPQTRSKNK